MFIKEEGLRFCRSNPQKSFCYCNSYNVSCPWQSNYFKVNLLVVILKRELKYDGFEIR